MYNIAFIFNLNFYVFCQFIEMHMYILIEYIDILIS